MKLLRVMLCVCLNTGVAYAQASPAGPKVDVNVGAQSGQPQLQLTTSVVRQRYRQEWPGSTMLRWTLKLTYTNTGSRAVILDKKSSLIFRSMISRSLKDAAKKRYVRDAISSSFYDLTKAGFRPGQVPREDAFVTLAPGESYSLEKEGYGTNIYDGTDGDEQYLRPGRYFLQVRVATWYYLSPPDAQAEKWRDKGYVWSRDVVSLPMPFTVDKRPRVKQCSPHVKPAENRGGR